MTNTNVKTSFFTSVAIALAMSASSMAQIYTSGHFDIAAHPHVEDGATLLETEFLQDSGNVNHVSLVNPTFQYNFGTSPRTSVNLGGSNSGSLLFVSPETETAADDDGMPFLGFSAEELTVPFTAAVSFQMIGFTYTGSGTGNFYLFEGTSLFWDSRAVVGGGAGIYGSFSVNVGSHGHGEFGFSDYGTYDITVKASGNNGSPVEGEPATFRFNVIPEPSCASLLLAGLATLSAGRRKRA